VDGQSAVGKHRLSGGEQNGGGQAGYSSGETADVTDEVHGDFLRIVTRDPWPAKDQLPSSSSTTRLLSVT
jgi:hypothetical protein